MISYEQIRAFYDSPEWRRLRAEVLVDDKSECQHCRLKGFYKRANTVHHVNYVRMHWELRLSKKYVDDDGKEQRNLISLCHDCHERVHGYRQEEKEQLNEERW